MDHYVLLVLSQVALFGSIAWWFFHQAHCPSKPCSKSTDTQGGDDMRPVLWVSVMLGLLSFATHPVQGSWGSGGCQTGIGQLGTVVPQAPAQIHYHWVRYSDPGDQDIALYYGPTQVGWWSYNKQVYTPLSPLTGSAGLCCPCPFPVPSWATRTIPEPKTCPCGCPCKAGTCTCGKTGPCQAGCVCGAAASVPPTGVQSDKITHGQTSISGRPATTAEAIAAIGANIPQDQTLPHTTVIGPEAKRKLLLTDLAEFNGKTCLHEYAPDEWPVQCGFKYGGDVTVYVQSPDGKVVHRQDDAKGAKEAVRLALRKADPNYDPAKDPDLRSPLIPNPFSPPGPVEIAWAWVQANPLLALAGVAVAYLLLRRK
jgi:hypothetical protein